MQHETPKRTRKKQEAAPPDSGHLSTSSVPVEMTLERGQDFTGSARRLVTHPPPAPTERTLLPPRERQNAYTLAEPGQRPLVDLVAINDLWHTQKPEDVLRVVAAPELEALAVEIEQRRTANGNPPLAQDGMSTRLITPALGALVPTTTVQAVLFVDRGLATEATAAEHTGMKRLTALFNEDYGPRERRFMDADPVPDAALPFEWRPHDYPMMKHLEAKYRPRFEQRHNMFANAAGLMPRRSIVKLRRKYFTPFRYPLEYVSEAVGAKGRLRACPLGESGQCAFQVWACARGHPEFSYVGAEFKLPQELDEWNERRRRNMPVSDASDGKPGLCIDDLLRQLALQVDENLQVKYAPIEPLNTFTVYTEPGEYDPRNMLEEKVIEQASGIDGKVPRYTTHSREFQTVALGPQRHAVTFLAEVGQDFWTSLSEANACLGARKSRPLIGSDTPRFVRAPVFLPRRALEAATGYRTVWLQFVRGAHACIYADRALLAQPTVPAAWLRRFLNLPPDEGNTLTGVNVLDVANTPLAPQLAALFDTADVGMTLTTLLDAALGTFERSVALWLQAVDAGRMAWALAPLAMLLGPDGDWQRYLGNEAAGLPLPSERVRQALHGRCDMAAFARALMPDREQASFVLWSVAVWRIAVALLASQVLYPASTTRGAEFHKQARYFCNTHLALLTHAWTRACYDDKLWFADKGALLVRHYPQANRVCCAEELPDMARALMSANLWFDKGNKKAQETIMQAIEQALFEKAAAQSCQRRGLADILRELCTAYASFIRYLRLIVLVVALGALPHVLEPPPLLTRMRLEAALGLDSDLTDAAFVRWVHEHPIITLFILREYFIYTVETDGLRDEIMAGSTRWPKFKMFVRLVNKMWRAALTEQTLADPAAPMDWTAIEVLVVKPPHGKVTKESKTSQGHIMTFHDKASKLNTKLKKGRWEEIMLRKMTGAEKDMWIGNLEHTPEAVDALVQWMRADNRLQCCHLLAWFAAQRTQAADATMRQRTVLEISILKLIGMSERGLDWVRRWQFWYYDYDTPDENMKKKARTLFAHSPRDYVLLKTFLHLANKYRHERPFFLSYQQTLMQVHTLRAALLLEPLAATLPTLGKAYYCDRCHTWATQVDQPSYAQTTAVRPPPRDPDAKQPAPPSATALAYGMNAPHGHVVSVRAAYCSPVDGQLYCRRCTRSRGADDVDEDEDEDWLLPNLSGRTTAAWLTSKAKRLERLVRVRQDEEDVPPSAPRKNFALWALAADEEQERPLLTVDLLGAYWQFHHQLYGLCVYCGRLAIVQNCNMTNLGLSCGGHALASECGRDHRLWEHLRVDAVHVQEQARRLIRPSKGAAKTLCRVCREQVAETWIEVYDFCARRFRMPLCRFHASFLKELLPLPLRGVNRTWAPPPVRCDIIVNKLLGEV